MSERLSHLDDEGRARMIDVGAKAVTRRVAVAGGRLETRADVIALVRANELPKADVLATARIAGIAAAKKTSDLIPLAHLLPLDSVKVEFELGETAVDIRATAAVTAKTGVEMEALTAVAIAGLTLHDMIKAVDPGCVLTDIRLLSKTGGKTPIAERTQTSGSAIILVSSTRAAAGTRADTTGPLIAQWADEHGFAPEVRVVPDAEIAAALAAAVAEHPSIVLTTGGTGASPTDRTPEATSVLLDRELPGIAEAIRAAGRAMVPTADLSRGLAGLAGSTIVINLPGSSGGVRDGLTVLSGLVPHLLEQLGGRDHS